MDLRLTDVVLYKVTFKKGEYMAAMPLEALFILQVT